MWNDINQWDGRNTNLLSLTGKLIDEDNLAIALEMVQRMEHMFRSFYWDYGVGGISACQAARHEKEVLRLFLLKDGETLHTLANPEVIDQSLLGIITRIACYSSPTGESALQAAPQWMNIQYLDLQMGTTHIMRIEHPLTNPALHEMTHMRGASFWDDVIPGTHVLTGDELKTLNAQTDEEMFKALLGDHMLTGLYKGGEVLYALKTMERFILDDGKMEILRDRESP